MSASPRALPAVFVSPLLRLLMHVTWKPTAAVVPIIENKNTAGDTKPTAAAVPSSMALLKAKPSITDPNTVMMLEMKKDKTRKRNIPAVNDRFLSGSDSFKVRFFFRGSALLSVTVTVLFNFITRC